MNSNRPQMELDFVLTIEQLPPSLPVREFIFPLIIPEDTDKAAFLLPLDSLAEAVDDFPAFVSRVQEACAYLVIPYHPEPEEDPCIYGFGVYVLWRDNTEIAFPEMLLLKQYSRIMYERYHDIATPLART